jgi:hypothetical protein
MLPKTCEKSQQFSQNPIPYPYTKQATFLKVGKMKLGMGALEEHNRVCAPIVQPSTINHQYSPSLQDVGVCIDMKISKSFCKP